jgi:Gram-negative bacterial TonB protein C-terminal
MRKAIVIPTLTLLSSIGVLLADEQPGIYIEGEAAAQYYFEQHGHVDLPVGIDAYKYWYYSVGQRSPVNPYVDSGDGLGQQLFAEGFAHYAAIHNPAPPPLPPPPPGKLISSPRPPYPPQAMSQHISGEVRVKLIVQDGNVVDGVAISGPQMLTDSVIRWCKGNWKFSPGTNGNYILPMTFTTP